MLFNSFEFLLFFPIVFVLYWILSKQRLIFQNILLLVASYVFYGWWDYRFLALIFLSTLVDYSLGLYIHNSEDQRNRKIGLWGSMVFNLGLLVFFKYFNFFAESWVEAFNSLGYELDPWTVSVILPVGISFYTFQTMSYSIDIYKGKLEPTKDFIGFAAFVSFFPQLVAGPIERATNLLPQILKKRTFDQEDAINGSRLILWGMFKKVVIADQLALSVNEIFANHHDYSSGTLILGAIYFALQIYCDFSGYSDIAIGTARLFGIKLMKNFDFPYFSRSIGEFWRRWHISLSTWFRDYLYIPLGGSRVDKPKAIRNVFIVFLVSGFWHGANWTFIIWGAIHALLFIPSFITGRNRKEYEWRSENLFSLNNFKNVCRVAWIFSVVTFAWIFFRAESLSHALSYINGIFSFNSFNWSFINPYDFQSLFAENILVIMFFILEILFVSKLASKSIKPVRWVAYIAALFIIVTSIHLKSELAFIYFQF